MPHRSIMYIGAGAIIYKFVRSYIANIFNGFGFPFVA